MPEYQIPPSWKWEPLRRRILPGSAFFEEGDLKCSLAHKQVPVEDVEEEINCRCPLFECSMSGCKRTFQTIGSYESHYRSAHVNACHQCKRVFPTNYLLDLHIMEWHDPMFEIMSAKEDMYQCLVESCEAKFKDGRRRKDHLVKCHHYPSSFRWDRFKRDNKSQKGQGEAMDVTSTSEKCQTQSPKVQQEASPSPRKFSCKVPNSICFGAGATRSFQRPHHKGKKKKKQWYQAHQDETMDTSVNIENVNMQDIAAALDS